MGKRTITFTIIGLIGLAGIAHAIPKVYKTKDECNYCPQDQLTAAQKKNAALVGLYYLNCMECIDKKMYYNFTTLSASKCIAPDGAPAPAPAATAVTKKAIEAGPLNNQAAAQSKCPSTCTSAGGVKWTGGWWTTVPSKMSVCECEMPPAAPVKKAIEAGPLNNQAAAQSKCPSTCTSAGAKSWTGGWWTTVPSKMSVCECSF